MAYSQVLILNSGGLRSLVATAVTLQDAIKTRGSLLHIIDGRENNIVRSAHLQSQADHFSTPRVIEIDLPHLFGHGHGKQPDGSPMGSLTAPQYLLAALQQARFLQSERIIWPCSFNQDMKTIARATEQMLLLDHLADLEGVPMPRIETPLIELTDKQIIELGAQLDVPWQFGWSCLTQNPKPCRACPACLRRKQAFQSAGLIDPAFNPDAVTTQI
ncbi:7-cyano-7-deazaguanine synthase [Poriferisphaera sp. WC338]|uniref:7-cyano-7-deazaguanine synthase n=1 Tax=Poriferisphaera sp. WC338 TaxID=3425129 RepID=UPI003D81B940